jgi:hypothetical protein
MLNLSRSSIRTDVQPRIVSNRPRHLGILYLFLTGRRYRSLIDQKYTTCHKK